MNDGYSHTCAHCGIRFNTQVTRAKFCSGRCRTAYWRSAPNTEPVSTGMPGGIKTWHKKKDIIQLAGGTALEGILEFCNREGCTLDDVLRCLTVPNEPKPGSMAWKLKYKA